MLEDVIVIISYLKLLRTPSSGPLISPSMHAFLAMTVIWKEVEP